MSDPIRDAITRAIINAGDSLIEKKSADTTDRPQDLELIDGDGPFDFYEAIAVLPPGKTREQMILELATSAGVSIEAATDAYRRGLDECRIAKSSRFQVAVNENCSNGFGEPMVHLSIKRLDREPIHDWRELQQIKNALVGDESEAIELFPAESRLVDSANQYHLWCFRPGFKLPVGFDTRLVAENDCGITGSKQRPFLSPDATLPSRTQLAAALRDLLNQMETADGVVQLQTAEAQALVDRIDLTRQPLQAKTAIQLLALAVAHVKQAQEMISPLALGELAAHDDQEVRTMVHQLSIIIDDQLQESRDDLTRTLNDLDDLPPPEQQP